MSPNNNTNMNMFRHFVLHEDRVTTGLTDYVYTPMYKFAEVSDERLGTLVCELEHCIKHVHWVQLMGYTLCNKRTPDTNSKRSVVRAMCARVQQCLERLMKGAGVKLEDDLEGEWLKDSFKEARRPSGPTANVLERSGSSFAALSTVLCCGRGRTSGNG